MIVTETTTINGKEFTHTYSDEGRYVVRDGVSYEDALDPVSSGRTYTEGDYINRNEDSVDDDEELEDDEVAKVLMGEDL